MRMAFDTSSTLMWRRVEAVKEAIPTVIKEIKRMEGANVILGFSEFIRNSSQNP